jgi:hypothetical protein
MMQKRKLILAKVIIAKHKEEMEVKLLKYNFNKILEVNIKITNITCIQTTNCRNK